MNESMAMIEEKEAAFWEVLYGADEVGLPDDPHWFEPFNKRARRFDDEF